MFYVLATLVYQEPNTAIFIANMLIGRTFFNLIPVFDAFALTMHEDIRNVSSRVFKSLRAVLN